MVMEYGMSEKVGAISYGNDHNEVFLGRDLGNGRNFSEEIGALLDSEIKALIDNAYKNAEQLLKDNINKLHAVAKALLEKEKAWRGWICWDIWKCIKWYDKGTLIGSFIFLFYELY